MLPIHVDTVIFKRLGDGAVVYDSIAEVYYGLNDAGAHIWELLGGKNETLDDLVAGLRFAYPQTQEERLRADATALVAALVAYGLIRTPEGVPA